MQLNKIFFFFFLMKSTGFLEFPERRESHLKLREWKCYEKRDGWECSFHD